jgi:uncharacterized DUF497 family protein
MRFTWDEAKNAKNIARHGFSFADAHRVFEGPVATTADTRDDYGEDRWIAYGYLHDTLVQVAFTMPSDDETHIISLRKANAREKAEFEE